jgi:hypothetical protein
MFLKKLIENRITIYMILLSTPGHISKNVSQHIVEIPAHHIYISCVHNSQTLVWCPSTEKWVMKIWYISTRKYYSTQRKNENMLLMENEQK